MTPPQGGWESLASGTFSVFPGASMEVAQGCIIIGDGQPWPEYVGGCCRADAMGRATAGLAG